MQRWAECLDRNASVSVNPARFRTDQFAGSSRGAIMQIKLQSTVGNFQRAFMRKLPLIEQAMVARDLDPADVVICKDRATPSSTIPLIDRFFYDYTVFVGAERFTVTKLNDMRFLEYFYKRFVAPEPEARRPLGTFGRLMRLSEMASLAPSAGRISANSGG
jgi:hypothetical protein